MKCDTIHSKIIFYLDDELPAEEKAEMQKHLDECMACNKLFTELSKTYQLTDSVPPLSDDFTNRLMDKLNKNSQPDSYTQQFITFSRRIAAVILLMLVTISITAILAHKPDNNLSHNNQQDFIEYYFADLDTYDIDTYYENEENN